MSSNEDNLIQMEMFTDIVENHFGKVSITKFDMSKMSFGSENYMCWMYEVDIGIRTEGGIEKSLYLMAKVMPPNDPQEFFKKSIHAFEKEVIVYEKIIPSFEDLYRDYGVQVSFGAHCHKTMTVPELLIFENLKISDYKNIDRLRGMNRQQSEIVLQKLAKFHAASACTLRFT